MNAKHEGAEQRLRAADPASNHETPVAESVLGDLGQKKPSLRLPRRGKRAAIAGGGAGAAALALTLTLTLGGGPSAPLITLGDASAQTTAQAGRNGADSSLVAGAVESDAVDKMMIWQNYNYAAGAGLSDEAGRGSIYKVERSGDPKAILKGLAAIFGVTGTPTEDEYSTAEYPSYSITGEDFYLSIYWSGTGSWSFGQWVNEPWVDCVWPIEEGAVEGRSAEGETTEATDSTAEETLPTCEEPVATPELIPGKSALQAEAFELFSATGYNGALSDIIVHRDEWGAWATAAYQVAGQPVAIEWSAGWGSTGELNWAGGHSVAVAKIDGDFGVISASAAVSRLNESGWWGGLPSIYYEDSYSTGAIGYPMGGEGDDIDVTIDAAEQVLVTVYDAAGEVWLVPGYAMSDSLGGVQSTIAVEDGVIALPDYSDVMPLDGVKITD